MPMRFFAPERYPGGFAITTAVEGSFLGQTLADPDVFNQTSIQRAYAGALQLRAKYDYLRINVLGMVRSLSFIQFNVPSLTAFLDFPGVMEVTDEKFLAVGFDYYFPRLHLTPGVIGGVQFPAAFTSRGVVGGLLGSRTAVMRDENLYAILPTGESPTPVYSTKFTMLWQLSDYFAAVGEFFVNLDNNRTTFRDSSEGVAETTFEKPLIIGFNTVLQARF
jgi:hypothetical protein